MTIDLRSISDTVDVLMDVSAVKDAAGDEETQTRPIGYAVMEVY
jgi:hypothetical protein